MIDVRRGERYRHLKTGGVYHVIAMARVEANLEPVVVYRKVDPRTWNYIEPRDENTWTRPLAEFGDGRFEQVAEKSK